MLYGYVRDKDVFEVDYQGYLASRLLEETSHSEQAEKQMIALLKASHVCFPFFGRLCRCLRSAMFRDTLALACFACQTRS